MRAEFSSPIKKEKLVSGDGLLFNVDLPSAVWNTITLDPSTAGKKVEIHLRNLNLAFIQRTAGVREIDDSGNPVAVGLLALIGGQSTTAMWVTANKNGEIQVRNETTGLRFIHVNTLI